MNASRCLVFDIDLRTLNLGPRRIEEAITPRTQGILVVHAFGVPAAMTEIIEIAHRHGLLVIEDTCKSLGAEVGGKRRGVSGTSGYSGSIQTCKSALQKVGWLLHRRRKLPRGFVRCATMGVRQ